MTGTAKAMASFWGKLLPCWPENGLPDNTPFPYITYSLQQGKFGAQWRQVARIWCEGEDEARLWELCDYVAGLVPDKGVALPLEEGGALWLRRGAPFVAWVPGQNSAGRRLLVAQVNVIVHSYG